MPPFGLYAMPRHHLYGGRTKSKTYNSNDFQGNQDEAAASDRALSANLDVTPAPQAVSSDSESKKKVARKDKKRLLSLNGDKNAELERLLDRAEATPDKEDLSKTKKKDKKLKKKHRRSNEDTQGAADATHVTPVLPAKGQKSDKNSAGQQHRTDKKRKRDSDAHASAANAQLVSEEYLAGQQLDFLTRFGSSPPKQPRQDVRVVDQLSKKKMKRKSQSIQQNATEHVPSAQALGPDQTKEQKTKRKSVDAGPGPSEAAAKHRVSKSPLPVPRDCIDGSDELKVKERKKNQGTKALVSSSTTLSPILPRVAKQTPIPLPQLRTPIDKPAGKTHKDKGDGLPRFQVLVPETPPSKTQTRTPVPFPANVNVNVRNDTVTAEYSLSKDYPQTGVVSSPTPNGNVPAPSAVPAAPGSSQTVPKLPAVPNALTDANLRSFKQPLADGTKPRPRTKTGTSTVVSFPTSSASMSIVDAFARVGKPLVRPAVEKDPFITTSDKPKGACEGRGIPLDIFTEKYREVTDIVDFEEEDMYLDEHLEWDAKSNQSQVPCLHKMTSCSAKKEELIRLSKDENMQIIAQLDTPADDLAKLDEANNQSQRAEDLLMLATKARMPVPIGCIEGKWTLYCPKYAETHFDRYGYGQRSLFISSIAGFKHKNTFTARMQLPPRTMAFSILAFQIPPHASFRTTTIKTASEGYTMDVVFLGNGFLHLRADLGRLLTGTTRKPNEDNYVLEFIGVHDQATQWWWDKKSQVEDEGIMFAKDDGNTIRE
ncbi:hypothetical protein PMIN06_006372 [Paraphaeosphaeria minitans]|uniref:Uncharacterized protein n=1 Tax=Paraphaeosphaeria minitans TaxID=565426 RepID=A0A9P6G955_9PLEO|nr:hypothetical protein PMIN01_11609 [Paraphaeosphaeria minitans]